MLIVADPHLLDPDQRIAAVAEAAAAEPTRRPTAQAATRQRAGRSDRYASSILLSRPSSGAPARASGRIGRHLQIAGEGRARLGRPALLQQHDAVPAPGVGRRVGIVRPRRHSPARRGSRRPASGCCAAARSRLRGSAAGRSSHPWPACRSTYWLAPGSFSLTWSSSSVGRIVADGVEIAVAVGVIGPARLPDLGRRNPEIGHPRFRRRVGLEQARSRGRGACGDICALRSSSPISCSQVSLIAIGS